MQSMEDTIRQFFIDNAWLEREQKLLDTDSLIEAGVIDSIAMIELIGFIEETYDIQVPDEELMPEHFDSLAFIVDYIEKKRQVVER